jgi:hypothetical protein
MNTARCQTWRNNQQCRGRVKPRTDAIPRPNDETFCLNCLAARKREADAYAVAFARIPDTTPTVEQMRANAGPLSPCPRGCTCDACCFVRNGTFDPDGLA